VLSGESARNRNKLLKVSVTPLYTNCLLYITVVFKICLTSAFEFIFVLMLYYRSELNQDVIKSTDDGIPAYPAHEEGTA